ncbi:hypothetical protein [uncultured Croceitalea sp.]|uniref:hypothetical protein n=1 Tax=uncultured Croceitalea sp. TaxID=1798908 RepID=UPI003306218C
MKSKKYYLKRRISKEIALSEDNNPCFECIDEIGNLLLFEYDWMINLIQSKKAMFLITLNGIDYKLKPKRSKKGLLKVYFAHSSKLKELKTWIVALGIYVKLKINPTLKKDE